MCYQDSIAGDRSRQDTHPYNTIGTESVGKADEQSWGFVVSEESRLFVTVRVLPLHIPQHTINNNISA